MSYICYIKFKMPFRYLSDGENKQSEFREGAKINKLRLDIILKRRKVSMTDPKALKILDVYDMYKIY